MCHNKHPHMFSLQWMKPQKLSLTPRNKALVTDSARIGGGGFWTCHVNNLLTESATTRGQFRRTNTTHINSTHCPARKVLASLQKLAKPRSCSPSKNTHPNNFGHIQIWLHHNINCPILLITQLR
jgi:hypothetical protein